MIPVVLLATALLVRVGASALFPGPAYPDSYYYVHVAQQVAAGHGLTSTYLWNLDDISGRLAATPDLPVPANGYWMPLAELVQLPTTWLFGPTQIAATLPFLIIGACAAPLIYWIARDAGLGTQQAAAAGFLVAAPAGLTPFVAQPDTFALMMTLGALALWLCARGARGDQRAFVIGGVVVGLATLARADAALLGLPYFVVWARGLLPGRPPIVGWPAAMGCAALFALTMAPWLYRQFEVYGSPLPSAGSGRLLWLVDYQGLFSIANPPTPGNWLAQGIGGWLSSRAGGLIAALGLFSLTALGAVLAPFGLIGAWLRRHDAAFFPFLIFAVALLLVTVLLFPVLVLHGTFMHAAAALVPHALLLVVVGVAGAVAWVARRTPRWDSARATRNFTWAAVGVASVVAGAQTWSVTRDWWTARSTQQELVAALNDVPATDRFMAVDPGAINYLTGRAGVLTPADDLATIEATMRAYDVRWLVLESGSIVPALAPVLEGSLQPSWLSAPVALVPTVRAPGASTTPAASVPAGAVYAVCLTAEDTRCSR